VREIERLWQYELRTTIKNAFHLAEQPVSQTL
jgi:hypothetical protein